jgi:hypothetical protein
MRTINDYFRDWESEAFGFGYGTGEPIIIPIVKRFFEIAPANGDDPYSYEKLENELSPSACWFVINALCHADTIEYGSSPRFGWLTKNGRNLKEFFANHSTDELIDLATRLEDEAESTSGKFEELEEGNNPFLGRKFL